VGLPASFFGARLVFATDSAIVSALLSLHCAGVLMAMGSGSAKKVALVVGNSAYQSIGRLENPENDATAIVKALERLSFDEVISAINLIQKDLLSRLQQFYDKLGGESLAVLFYAGHGVQVWGQNYLLPCDAKVTKTSDLQGTAIALNDVVRAMSRRANTRLIFLDACRNDPLSNQAGGLVRGARAGPALGNDLEEVGPGLAKVTATAGTFVAYATEPGNVALDGTGSNSPFTGALAKHIAQPGLSIDDIMMQVRVDVLDATQGKQLPWSESALTRRFQFQEGPAQDVTRDFEREYWDRVKDTDNPDFLETFLRQFPNGRYAGAARAKVADVQERKEIADWELARSTDTIAALAQFARRYPRSRHASPARARLLLRQMTGGFTVFNTAVSALPAFTFFAWLLYQVTSGLTLDPLLGQLLTDNLPPAMLRTGVFLTTGVIWFIFGVFIWKALVRLAQRPIRRFLVTTSIAAFPAVACLGYAELDRALSPEPRELSEASAKVFHEAQAIYRQSKLETFSDLNDLETRLQSLTTSSLDGLNWRRSYDRRHITLLAAIAAGVAAFCTILLAGTAISGSDQIGAWGTSMRGSALVAALAFLALTINSHALSHWAIFITMLEAVWYAVMGFLVLGLVRVSASEAAWGVTGRNLPSAAPT
jgi:hypothetical protein